LIAQISNESISSTNRVRSVLLGKQEATTLLATTNDVTTLTDQTATDQAMVDQKSVSLYVQACKTQSFSSGDLNKDLKKAVSTNEDVGRYVGYGWKEVNKGSFLSL
jgi:hypothetical protein